MNMIIVGVVVFGVIWIWIGWEMYNAPLIDENKKPTKYEGKSEEEE